MLLQGIHPVDPASLIAEYQKEGLADDLLRKCNAQSFKLIDGAGEGYFLVTSDQLSDLLDAESNYLRDITFTVIDSNDASITHDFPIVLIEIHKLNHPSQTDTYFAVVRTMEEKYLLKEDKVLRNYNIVDRDSIASAATISEINYAEPDNLAQLTLVQIIEDISGLTVNSTAPSVTPYDVNIQGLTVLDAIDYMCSVYGLLWTMNNGEIYIIDTIAAAPDYITDTRHLDISTNLKELQLVGPVYANGVISDSRHGGSYNEGAIPGKVLSVYMPFYPTYIKTDTTIINDTGLQTLATTIFNNFKTVSKLEGSYYVYNHYNTTGGVFTPFTSTACLKLTFADYGAGPRTIYSSVAYPYLLPLEGEGHEPANRNTPGSTPSGTADTVWAVAQLTVVLPSGIDNTSSGATVIAHNDLSNPSLATITVVNSGESKGYVGCRVFALKVKTDPSSYEWRVVWVQQPALKLKVTLDGYPAAGIPSASYAACDPRLTNAGIKTASPAPVSLTPFPFDFIPTQDDTVPNPLKLLGYTGDTAILGWDKNTEDYFVEEVFSQYEREVWVTLNANRGNGPQATVACNLLRPGSIGGMVADPFNVKDKYDVMHNAKAGFKALIKYDPDEGMYVFITGQYKTRIFHAQINGAFSSSDPTFNVDNIVALDGGIGSVSETVQNRCGWPSGDDNAVVYCVWNNFSGTYDAIQMAWTCPP